MNEDLYLEKIQNDPPFNINVSPQNQFQFHFCFSKTEEEG